MGIIQCTGDLPDIRNNGIQWQLCTFRMALAQGAIGSKLLYNKRCISLQANLENLHNIGMRQKRLGLHFIKENFCILPSPWQPDSNLLSGVGILAQVNAAIAALA